ncbi:MAG: hypothetical protein K2V38_03710, partial [Gemmataceae bacterium]|nr:hypothetical protein [Gemmataceae bacterium]
MSASLAREVAPGEIGDGFQIVSDGGLWYALPNDLVHVDPERPHRALKHPATLVALTREGLQAQIETFDRAAFVPESAGEFEDYTLFRLNG